MLQELPFHAQFDGMRHFRFHLGERGRIACQYLSTGSHIRNRIGDKRRHTVAYDTISTAKLRERNPFGHLYPLIGKERDTGGRIKESFLLIFRVSQRRRPVVTCGQVKEDSFFIANLCRRKDRLQLVMGIYFLIDTGRTAHHDIGKIEHVGIFQRSILRINASRVSDSVIDTAANGYIQCEVIQLLLDHRHHVSVHLRFLIIHFNIAPVHPTECRSGGGIKFLTQFIG